MSAFVVDPATINRFLSFLLSVPAGEFRELFGRYPDCTRKDIPGRSCPETGSLAPYYFEMIGGVSLETAYRSLTCFFYQSCEAGCDDEPLYKVFANLSDRIAPRLADVRCNQVGTKWG